MSINFGFLDNTIKRLKTRETTLVQSLGLEEKAVKWRAQVRGPLEDRAHSFGHCKHENYTLYICRSRVLVGTNLC